MQVLRRDRQQSCTLTTPRNLGTLIQKSNNKNKISIVTFFPYSIIGSYHVVHSCLWAPALIVSDVFTCMIHDLCAKMLRQKVERRIMRIWSRTHFSGMEENDIRQSLQPYVNILIIFAVLAFPTISVILYYHIKFTQFLQYLRSVVTGLLYHFKQ